MPDIDQKLLAQQKELYEARTAAQNEDALKEAPGVSIAEYIAARDAKNRGSLTGEPDEMEADLRAEQIEAQNRAAANGNAQDGALEKARKTKEQIEKIQKTMKAAKGTARTVNFASAATIIGLIITFIVMNFQLIAGNIFGAKWVPKLEVWEMVLVGVVDLLVFLIVMIAIGIIGAITGVIPGVK